MRGLASDTEAAIQEASHMGLLKSFLVTSLLAGGIPDEHYRTAVDLELVIAADVSYSMDMEDQRIQRLGYVEAFRDPEVLRAVRGGALGRIAVTYVEWGGSAVQVIPWTIIDSVESAEWFAAQLSQRPLRRISFTSISNALAFARELIRSGGFRAPRHVIDVSGDGPNNAGAPAPVARNAALAEGIVVDGLPLMLDRPSASIPDLDIYYQRCVIGGEGAFVLKVTELGQLAEAIRRKLVIEISGPKLSEVPPSGSEFAPAAYGAYDCFIGEELEEQSIGR